MLGSHTEIPVFPIGGEAERKGGGKATQLLTLNIYYVPALDSGREKVGEIRAVLTSTGWTVGQDEGQWNSSAQIYHQQRGWK